MIEGVRFSNYRVLRDVTIDFEPFTILVGPNGSGKTTVLRSFYESSEQRILGNTALQQGGSLIVVPKVSLPGFEMSIVAGGQSHRLEDGRSQLSGEEAAVRDSFLSMLNNSVLLQLDGLSLRQTTLHETSPQKIEVSGRGLGAVLADVLLTQRQKSQRVTDLLAKIVPGVVELKAVRDKNSQANYRVHIEFDGVGEVDTDDISEGTLLALAILLTVVVGGATLILIDDLDKGLHPAAQAKLVEILRGVIESRPGLQIIATTHSPYLLDCFDASEVRVLSLGNDGYAQCKKLTEHPNFAEWEGALKAGEMWASVGEDWIREPVAS